MRLTLMHVVSVLCLPYFAGCSSPTDTYECLNSAERSFALAVVLTDASTGAKAPFYHVKAVAVDGDFVDSTMVDSLRTATVPAAGYVLRMGSSRPGTYDIRVEADGYAPWVATGVEVRVDKSDLCGHVLTRQFTAQMKPI
jgi:hypothetical protein